MKTCYFFVVAKVICVPYSVFQFMMLKNGLDIDEGKIRTPTVIS